MQKGTIGTPSVTLDPADFRDEKRAKELYHQYRDKVISWTMKHYRVSKSVATERYQEAFTICFYQVRKGSLTSIRCELSTYLAGIVKNLMKQNSTTTSFVTLDDLPDTPSVSNLAEEEMTTAYNNLKVDKLLENSEEPCRSILTLFYRRQFSLEAIATELKYKNANVVKKKKSLCLKYLRELFGESNPDTP